MSDALAKILRDRLKAGLNRVAGNSMNTNMQRRIVQRLHFVAFGKIKIAFDRWKYDTFAKLAAEMDAKKARVLDMLV
jgi:hypothetical protein